MTSAASAPRPGADHGDRSSLRRLVDALSRADVWHRVRGDHVDFRCPRPDHPDRDASGSADWRAPAGNRPGSVRLICHACGPAANADVIAALGLTFGDLFDDPPTRPDASSPRARSPRPRPARSTSTRAPAGEAPAGEAPAGGKAAAPRSRGQLVATYVYRDRDDQLVGECRRYEAPAPDRAKPAKVFSWRRPAPAGGWTYRMPSPCPLYRLPDLAAARTAAAAAGRPARVWLVEGEKNADAMAAALAGAVGECAVSAPNGAHFGWADVYTAELAGCDVVLVADRDDPGITRAAAVAGALAGAAASVRIVRTPVDLPGADASDHLDAGHGLGEFVDAAPAPTEPAGDAPAGDVEDQAAAEVVRLPTRPGAGDDQYGGGAGGGGRGRGGPTARVVRDEFAQVDTDEGGAIVEVRVRDGDLVSVELLDARVRVVRRIAVDAGDGTPIGVKFLDLEARRGDEVVTLPRVPVEDFRKATYLDLLPWAVCWTDTTSGRSKLANAITRTSGPVPVTRSYGTLGWREIGGTWTYVHAAGGISAAGAVPGIEVDVSPRLAGFRMPAPPSTPAELATAVRGVLAVLDDLPARIAAPVMGGALRAVLGDQAATDDDGAADMPQGRASVFVVGHTGSRKSGLAALAQQLFMPGARHNRLPVGAGEAATTGTAMEELLFQAADALLVADDLAPDRSAERASARANELLRMVGNGSPKARGARTGGLRPDRPPRALLMLTGEDGASRPSAESRTVYVSLAPGDVPREVIRRLSGARLIKARTAAGAALVQYVAGRMPLGSWLEETCAGYADQLLAGAGADPDGLATRRADAVAELAAGWRALLDAAMAGGALDVDAARAVWERVWTGLVECLAEQGDVADRRGLVERAADLLRSCLRSGRVHLESEEGRAPAADRWRACGWRKDESLSGDVRPAGDAVGWVTDDRRHVWLDPGSAFAAIERQARAESDPLAVTKRALVAALLAARVLSTETAADRARPTPQVRRKAAGARQRVWELPWSWLWPDDVENGPTGEDGPAAGPDDGPAGPDDDAPRPPAPALPGLAANPLPAGTPATPRETPRESGNGPERAAERPATASAPVTRTEPGEGRTGRFRAAQGGSAAQPRYRAAGVVVDVDRARLVGGDVVELPDDVDSLPALAAWADGLGLGVEHARSRDDAGQVWIMPRLARRLRLGDRRPAIGSGRATTSHPAVRALTDAGWTVGHRGLQPWTHLWRPGEAGQYLVIVPWLGEDALCSPTDPPSVDALADRLDLYASLVVSPTAERQPWLFSAATTGTTHLRLCRATATTGPLRVDQLPAPAIEDDGRRWEAEFAWQRGPTDAERAAPFVIALDVNAQYLAAAGAATLGLGEAHHVPRQQLPDVGPLGSITGPARPAKLPPGYWRVPRPTGAAAALLPDLVDPAGAEHADTVCVTTPTLVVARQHGVDLRPVEAWLWERHTTWLQAWAHSLRDARYALDAAIENNPNDDDYITVMGAVKLTYAAGIGMLGSRKLREGTDHYRPDARHHVIATAKANLFRKCAKAAAGGRAPLGVWRDAVLFASDSDDPDQAPPDGFQLGRKLGQVKWDGAVRMDDIADRLAESSMPTNDTFGLLR